MDNYRPPSRGHGVAALVCFLVGMGLLIQSVFQPPESNLAARIAPAVVALTFALLFWGFLTVRNIFQLVAMMRGQPLPDLPPPEGDQNDLDGGEYVGQTQKRRPGAGGDPGRVVRNSLGVRPPAAALGRQENPKTRCSDSVAEGEDPERGRT